MRMTAETMVAYIQTHCIKLVITPYNWWYYYYYYYEHVTAATTITQVNTFTICLLH